jgi:hypothetical protein
MPEVEPVHHDIHRDEEGDEQSPDDWKIHQSTVTPAQAGVS